MTRNREGESQRRKDRCTALNLCLICGNPRDTSKSTCSSCLKKKSERRKALRLSNQAKGLCLCGRAITTGKMCDKCKAKGLREKMVNYANAVQKGVCPRCGTPISGRIYCLGCTGFQIGSRMLLYKERKELGKCPSCGNELIAGEKFRCATCNARHVATTRAVWHRNRDEVIAHYGGKCECCGESTREFLTIDHINNNGKAHRRKIGSHLAAWIIKNNFPADLRVLCSNCNCGRSKFGVCPHQRQPEIRPGGSRDIRHRVIEHYGSKCVCCGETNWAFLEFDHKNNDGAWRRRAGDLWDQKAFTSWILHDTFPSDLQLLCSNCNLAKGLWGTCPHQQEDQLDRLRLAKEDAVKAGDFELAGQLREQEVKVKTNGRS